MPVGHCLSLGKAAGSSIMSGSDKGAQLGRRGDQIRALLFLYSRKGKKIKRKKERKSTLCFSNWHSPLLWCHWDQGWSRCGSLVDQGLEGQFLGFWEQMKDLGREQGWGVECRARVALVGQGAHGMGSATLASLHPLVSPQHLCNELIQARNGDGSCTGRELSSSGC